MPVFPLFAPPTTLANRRHNTVFSPYFTCLLVPVFPSLRAAKFTCLLVPVFPLVRRQVHLFISACFSPVCAPSSCVCCSLRSTLASPYFTCISACFPPLFFSTRPMSSSSDDEHNEGYLIVKASSFRRKSFWTWAKGADFLTIPFTGTKIRCVLEENLEDVDVDVPCRECVEVWERSGLRDSLQSVQWGGSRAPEPGVFWYCKDVLEHMLTFFFMKDPRLTLFLMACEAAKEYSFMDGVSKILSIRMLDLVLSHGLCHTHIRSLTV